jgi:hypothetical protein
MTWREPLDEEDYADACKAMPKEFHDVRLARSVALMAERLGQLEAQRDEARADVERCVATCGTLTPAAMTAAEALALVAAEADELLRLAAELSPDGDAYDYERERNVIMSAYSSLAGYIKGLRAGVSP